MTNLPDDLLDPAEGRLIRSVRALAEPAVVPIDPMAIAASAAASRPRGRTTGRLSDAGRLGWLLAAVLVGGAIGIGALSTTSATPTPPPSAAAAGACVSSDLAGRIVRWEGAAGNRIATVELRNTGDLDCRLTPYELSLVDGGGRGQGMIVSHEPQPGLALSAGTTIHTLVDVTNYCRAYVPVEPVSIRLDDADTQQGDVVLTPATGEMSGVPPCNGAPGSAGSITQQPWAPGPAGS